MSLAAENLHPGFADPVHDSQRTFRALLSAFSRPGHVVDLGAGLEPPAPLSAATAALALALFDHDTPAWLDAAADCAATRDFLRFHCGCPLVADSRAARFALVADAGALTDLNRFDMGDALYPERAATVVVQVASVREGTPLTLSGPGIKQQDNVRIGGLPDAFWRARQQNSARYPLGIDVALVGADGVLGLPRTTRAQATTDPTTTDPEVNPCT